VPDAATITIDLIAIVVLAGLVYFPRHRRRDMLFAYVALNIGVMAVTIALDTATVAAGLGLGLFGVLSIIRLRSAELTHTEVAYFFVALSMGLLAGLPLDPAWASAALIGLLVSAVFLADHPRLLGGYRQQFVTLDATYTDEAELITRLEDLLGGEVKHVIVDTVDLVRDTTRVDVRFRVARAGLDASAPSSAGRSVPGTRGLT
jgi:hypothetical protein